MRCERMTLNVKHYSNKGCAVAVRDNKGKEEQKNIATLLKKWPGRFRMNPKRKNEGILSWRKDKRVDGGDDDESADEDDDADEKGTKAGRMKTKGGSTAQSSV